MSLLTVAGRIDGDPVRPLRPLDLLFRQPALGRHVDQRRGQTLACRQVTRRLPGEARVGRRDVAVERGFFCAWRRCRTSLRREWRREAARQHESGGGMAEAPRSRVAEWMQDSPLGCAAIR